MFATKSLMSRPSPTGVTMRAQTRAVRPRMAPTRAIPDIDVLLVFGEVGDVEAPTGAIFIAAAIATVAVLLIPFGS